MIQVIPKKEPEYFDALVRKPGAKFLSNRTNQNIAPTEKEYKSHAYWTKRWSDTLEDLSKTYEHICAYCCEKIHPLTGNKQVDHFKPKSQVPYHLLAYEWSNYRLASGQLNNWKDNNELLDPFQIQDGWFVILFPSLEIEAADANVLPPHVTQEQIRETIRILRFNISPVFYKVRKEHLVNYCSDYDFAYLLKNSPFVAKELVRQGYVKTIKEIMDL
jgi:hypothetical protein